VNILFISFFEWGCVLLSQLGLRLEVTGRSFGMGIGISCNFVKIYKQTGKE